MWNIIIVGSMGALLTSDQVAVIRNFAAEYLCAGEKCERFTFKHELCEGAIIPGKEGTFGCFAGTFFRADLGRSKGRPWTLDFLIPRGTEMLDAVERYEVYGNLPFGFTPESGVTEIDPYKTAIRPLHPNRSRRMN